MHLVSPGARCKMLWHILAGHCDLSFYQAKDDVMAWQHTLILLLEISWTSPSRKAVCMKASKSRAQSMQPSRWGEKGSKHSGRCRMTVRNTVRQESSGVFPLFLPLVLFCSGSRGDLCFYMGREREGFFVVGVNFGIWLRLSSAGC